MVLCAIRVVGPLVLPVDVCAASSKCGGTAFAHLPRGRCRRGCTSFYGEACCEVLDFCAELVDRCGEFIRDGDCFSDSVMNLSGLLQEQV